MSVCKLYIWLTVQAVLASIIYVNLHGMMKQFMDVPALWRSNKVDMVSGVQGENRSLFQKERKICSSFRVWSGL